MPIHLNLLEEERAATRARERDPLRMAIFIGALILILAGIAGVVFATLSFVSKGEVARLNEEATRAEKDRQEAQRKLDELATLSQKMATSKTIRSLRFLYAPQLQAIKESIPDGVQLVRLSFDWETVKVPNPKFVQKSTEAEKKIPSTIDQKRMRLTLEGYIVGENPEAAMRQFMQLLNRTSGSDGQRANVPRTPLARLLGKAELKHYSAIAAAAARPGTSQASPAEMGRFSIDCYYLP